MLAKREGSWLWEVRSLVDERLGRFFEHKRASAASLAPEAVELVEAVARLTLRGGKRLRPALLVAAYRAVRPEGRADEVTDACAALELLQSYLLIHDDWMDHDEERRGGPSVHVALREAHGGDPHLGASLAILAGNLASAQAWDLLARGEWDPATKARAISVFLEMHQEVVFGQQLDLLASENVSLMQQLKTGSYTVRGPLLLGAALGGASEAERAALEAYGLPLGEAFQMRDDLLGTFGDPRATGKPAGGDIREGKRTALVRAAEEQASIEELHAIRAVLGRSDASDAEIGRTTAILESCGARARVEARLAALLDEARDALSTRALQAPGTEMLSELANRLAVRDR
ncbi:MAG: polyprenyl synthetase family protein [Sandaracinaceae bacterium]|nr:geranyl transferase [Myxococcales bacterium]